MTRVRSTAAKRGILAAAVLLLSLVAAVLVPAPAAADDDEGAVVVANRASGTISIIDTEDLSVATVALPGTAEPMYVNHDPDNETVFVGDRASDTVVAFDDDDYSIEAIIPVGAGVFHQWYDERSEQLWVVGDTSNTVTVVDGDDLDVITTIDIPGDLVAMGGKPHDVFVKGRRAFVSILGLADGTGVVLRYSTRTFAETGRIVTGADPHLFVDGNKLFVASQGASEVSRFNARTLAPQGSMSVPDAHGIFVTDRNEVLVTNIAGGGVDALWELNRRLNRVRDVTDLPFPTPHNITVDNDRRAYVTHSGGAADQVSIIDLDRRGFGTIQNVTVGLNPFGLAFVGDD